jgi:hypothetical protein
MDNPFLFMQILERLGDLGDDMPGQIFAKIRQTNNLVKQLAARRKLENDVVVLS